MPAIFLLCGLPASGKTTRARRLEAGRPAPRFTEDEWVTHLCAPEDVHDDGKRDAVKDLQWTVAVRAVRLGLDVVLDWGVWARSERDHYRARAARDGDRLRLVYLDVSREEFSRRLAARNTAPLSDTLHLIEEMLVRYWSVFQPPTADELAAT